MVDSARIREFRDRWQYQSDPTEEFKRFRIRMVEVGHVIWDDYFLNHQARRKRFAVVSGTPCTEYKAYVHGGLCKALKEAKTEFELVRVVQCLLWTIEETTTNGIDECCSRLQDALSLSPGIMIQLVHRDGKVMLYPAGVRMLDEALVEGNLAWLRRYPQAAKPFEDALRIYMTKDPNQYRNMLDSLRCSVEQILRAVLNNDKSLEKQKEEFLKWLAKYDAHSHIIGMYNDLLFNRFAKYQNDAVKHQEDNYIPAEVEFVLYVTGTFLRFIQRLAEQGVPAAKKTIA